MGGNPTTFAGLRPRLRRRSGTRSTRARCCSTRRCTTRPRSGRLDCTRATRTPRTAAPPPTDLAKACWAGGTIQIYVNTTLPAGITYAAVRDGGQRRVPEPHRPGQPGQAGRPQDPEEGGAAQRRRHRLAAPEPQRRRRRRPRPPYQSDAATPGQTIALSHFFGQHGYLPNYVDLPHNINMHATFVAAGPGIRTGTTSRACGPSTSRPTLAFLMGIPGPQNARGQILYELVEHARQLPGDHDPRHQRLPRPADAARRGGRQPAARARPSAIGGSAFLKPWFDVYEAESALSGDAAPNVIEVAGGDSVGGDAADLDLLRRHADDRDHEHDGHRRRRARATTTSTRARRTCGRS